MACLLRAYYIFRLVALNTFWIVAPSLFPIQRTTSIVYTISDILNVNGQLWRQTSGWEKEQQKLLRMVKQLQRKQENKCELQLFSKWSTVRGSWQAMELRLAVLGNATLWVLATLSDGTGVRWRLSTVQDCESRVQVFQWRCLKRGLLSVSHLQITMAGTSFGFGTTSAAGNFGFGTTSAAGSFGFGTTSTAGSFGSGTPYLFKMSLVCISKHNLLLFRIWSRISFEYTFGWAHN